MIKFSRINAGFLIVFITGISMTKYTSLSAQSLSPTATLSRIFKTYDSTKYLSFDVKYTYNSDTVNGNFVHDILQGSYTLAGRKAKFNLGDIEFVENDSFFITVYNNDKFILVADPRNTSNAQEMPLRQIMDSLKTVLSHYTAVNTTTGDTSIIKLTKADSLAQFEAFTLAYDNQQFVIRSIEYTIKELVPSDSSGAILSVIERKKQLRVEFSNYGFDNFSDSVYDENKYIFFEDAVCKPTERYKDFRIFYSRKGRAVSVAGNASSNP